MQKAFQSATNERQVPSSQAFHLTDAWRNDVTCIYALNCQMLPMFIRFPQIRKIIAHLNKKKTKKKNNVAGRFVTSYVL